jgi:rhamnogalacturonyl hydrolase YesR
MLHVADVTGDTSYRDYTLKNFDFIFDRQDYFRRQAAAFGPQPNGYRRLLHMAALDDCGAIGAALIEAYARKPDPRYRATIDAVADYMAHRQMRLPDGTVDRRFLHEHSVPRADGQADWRPRLVRRRRAPEDRHGTAPAGSRDRALRPRLV